MSTTNNKLTYLDQLVTSPNMQLVKAVLPYIGKNGSLIAVYIKFIEFQNTVKFINSSSFIKKTSYLTNGQNITDMSCLFDEIKDYLGDDMAETIELITSLLTMIKENPESGEDIMSGYMDMFKGMF